MRSPPIVVYVETNQHGGLGVALVRQIVEESGVRIEVRQVTRTADGLVEGDSDA